MRYAVCNELFGKLPLSSACCIAKEEGFDGLEFAPFTVFGEFTDYEIGKALSEIRSILDGEGLSFVGFHWLLAKPEGLHIASPDRFVRSRTWDHMRFLLDCAGALGGGKLILGSPRQRSTLPGMSREETQEILKNGLAQLGHHAASCNSMLLIEALSRDQTDIVTSLEEAVHLVEEIDHPAIQTMFDFHNARDETSPPCKLLAKYFSYIAHIHLNETDGGPPGSGQTDYASALGVLIDQGYSGWLSIEIFEVPEDPKSLLHTAMQTMQKAQRMIKWPVRPSEGGMR